MTARVIMVDDEESLVWSSRQYFELHKPEWAFEGYTDPIAALDRIRAAPPDVLVTDIRMPGMSGVELLVAARAVAPSLPVIVITAYGTHDVLKAVRARRGVVYMEKPIEFGVLFDEISRLSARQAGFSGDILLPMLPDLLQVYTLSMATGALTVRQSGRSGTVWLERGAITHAVCGDLRADDAVYELLTWTSGSFHLENDAQVGERTITKGWQHLLLEGSRRLDEARKVPAHEDDLFSTLDSIVRLDAPSRALKGLLSTLRADLPGVLVAVSINAATGAIVASAGSSGARASELELEQAAVSEVVALSRLNSFSRVDNSVCTLDDQLHFVHRAPGNHFVFVAVSRGPGSNAASIRNAIIRRLEALR